MRRIAIVGAGAAGLVAAHSLTNRAGEENEVSIFDPTLRSERRAGRGLAYRADDTNPLLNAPGQLMSICGHDADHFLRWYGKRFGPSYESHVYATRPIFGQYLLDELRSLSATWAERGRVLQLVPYSVTRIHRHPTATFSIETSASLHRDFDDIVLCPGWSGFHSSGRTEGTFSAYPLQMSVPLIAENSSVLVLGTGLTGVDVVRALIEHGYQGSITMASRRGLLPTVRPNSGGNQPHAYTQQRVQRETNFSVRKAVDLIREEAHVGATDLSEIAKRMLGRRFPRDALVRGVDGDDDTWVSMLIAVADASASESWNRFDTRSKRVFLRSLHPYFQSFCNPMPKSTGGMLLKAMESGQLKVCAGAGRWDGRQLAMSDRQQLTAGSVVQAHRAGRDHFVDVSRGFLGRMVSDGLARPSEFGGFDLKYASSRVIDRDGTPQSIYAIGALAQGARYYVSALDGIVSAMQNVVQHITRPSRSSEDVVTSYPETPKT